ncbi:hypothetical protein GON04_21330 [Ramlibacter sp. MAH-25]|uniref:GAE domain-containing protein n=2 Tax=Ramlibacter pinisoli TaxID=2682844 RepID=A0A6N8J1G6_9BURK|nr:hypothetical protein [Ramlibacter sp. CGMCC 1.13660]MBA2962073.1 hypothetical protein [Ramlibacter sp. CGMCC 1.13660]MVQ32016.1 hypothetical protein [Ramlibacter pinisoli]
MSTMTIKDLPLSRALDFRAMSFIRGAGGAPWVFGAFRAFAPESARTPPILNFFADQLNVQMQTINVENSAPNAVINVTAVQNAINVNVDVDVDVAVPKPF